MVRRVDSSTRYRIGALQYESDRLGYDVYIAPQERPCYQCQQLHNDTTPTMAEPPTSDDFDIDSMRSRYPESTISSMLYSHQLDLLWQQVCGGKNEIITEDRESLHGMAQLVFSIPLHTAHILCFKVKPLARASVVVLSRAVDENNGGLVTGLTRKIRIASEN